MMSSMPRHLFLPLFSIAFNTFREAVRSKVLGALVFFVVLATIGTSLLGEMSLHEEVRVTTDGALFMSTLFLVLIAVYSTVTLLHNEMERRTIYTILTKPIARWQFLIGKYLGVALLLGAIVLVLCGLALGLVAAQGGDFSLQLCWAFVTLYMQCLLVTALTLVFASFSSPLLSGMFTACVFVAGNLISQLVAAKPVLATTVPMGATLVDLLVVALPNFESLNLSWFVTHDEHIPLEYILAAGWYTASYVALALTLSIAIFSRRDLG